MAIFDPEIYDPRTTRSVEGVFQTLKALTLSTRKRHSVHVMKPGSENEVLSLEPVTREGLIVRLQFRLAANARVSDGDMITALNSDFPYAHEELYWREVRVASTRDYFVFDPCAVPDLPGQWQCHAIRNRYFAGYGHMISRDDAGAPTGRNPYTESPYRKDLK